MGNLSPKGEGALHPKLPLNAYGPRRLLRPLGVVALAMAGWFLFRHWTAGAAHLRGIIDSAMVGIAERSAGAWLVLLFYTAAGVVFIPVTLLAATTLAVFGMWPGIPIAWAGGLLSAILSHAIGKRLGPRVTARLPSRVETSLRPFLARRSFWAAVLMRIVPLGNFGVLNLAAGALSLPRWSFILGNMVGLAVALVGLGVIVERALALLSHPTALNVTGLVVVAGAIVGLTLWLRRRCRPIGN
jgi:uncharacterized membrane protein YdjX (TVP38/TMEM64 family)